MAAPLPPGIHQLLSGALPVTPIRPNRLHPPPNPRTPPAHAPISVSCCHAPCVCVLPTADVGGTEGESDSKGRAIAADGSTASTASVASSSESAEHSPAGGGLGSASVDGAQQHKSEVAHACANATARLESNQSGRDGSDESVEEIIQRVPPSHSAEAAEDVSAAADSATRAEGLQKGMDAPSTSQEAGGVSGGASSGASEPLI